MAKSKADIRIVILQRGWVMVGRFSKKGAQCFLDGASVIRYWGTKNGLGDLSKGPLAATKLDPCNGQVQFHEMTIVATLAVEANAWAARCQ